MLRLIILLALITTTSITWANEPEEVLDRYFKILTSGNTDKIDTIMDADSMASLKTMMDNAIRYQANHGNYELQRRVFGKKVSLNQVEKTSAAFYLNQLANSILDAASSQNFRVESRKVLGRIQEGDKICHIVARLSLQQNSESTSDIFVYTLVKEGGSWKLTFPPTIRQVLTVIDAQAKLLR